MFIAMVRAIDNIELRGKNMLRNETRGHYLLSPCVTIQYSKEWP
jgi:hypothetical protein